MEAKGEICLYFNSGNDHSSTTHKVPIASGICTCTADMTFGYSRRAWVGEVGPDGETSGIKVFEEDDASW